MGSDAVKGMMKACKSDILEALSEHDSVHPAICLKLIRDITASKFCMADRTTLMNAVTERGKTNAVKQAKCTSLLSFDGKNQDHFSMHLMLTADKWQILCDPKIPHTQKVFQICHVGLKLDIVFPSESTKQYWANLITLAEDPESHLHHDPLKCLKLMKMIKNQLKA